MRPEELRKTIAENLSCFREEAGLSQTEFAEAVGYDHNWAHRREQGMASIKLEDLPQIMTALGISDPSLLWQPRVQTRFRVFDDF